MGSSQFKWEPAVWLQLGNLVVAALVAFNILNGGVADAVLLVVAAIVALVTAALTRPLVVSAFVGVAQTLLTALAMMWPNLISETQAGTLLALLSVVLGMVLRQNVTPTTKAAA